jgi:hypothetical protein
VITMTASTDRLVYYSLSTGGPRSAAATRRLLRSIASLRAHNRAVPVRLFLCGALDAAARDELEASHVTVEELGAYEAHLASLCPARMSEVLARYPTLHKLTCLTRIAATGATRVLALDSDTVFFRDVDVLFDGHAEFDLYAREEPFSRASALGYRPELVDEDALASLASREGAAAVAPFNIGVVLYNHGSFRRLAGRIDEVLRHVFRFSVWLADRADVTGCPDLVHLREYRGRLVEAGDEAEALPYPSRNAWIRDQVAVWLSCGKLPGLRVGTFAARDVLQGGEFMHAEPGRHVMVHHFAIYDETFAAWLADQALAVPAPPVAAHDAGPRAAPSMRLFEDLGARLDDAWQRLDYDERVFPELAAAALHEARVHREISGGDVVRWLLAAREIPEQDDLEAGFGHPPVTVYHGRRFYIQALLWAEGATTIHRHAFSGAFVVLDGSSLHVRHTFELRWRVSSRLLLGSVRRETAALLAPGAVVEITPDLIHSTFHLDVPSATVVVRTYRDQESAIQYDYLPPTVAFDPFFEDPGTKRRLQALRFLRRTKQPGHVELAADLVARSDLHTAWVVLLDAYRYLGSAARAAPILAAARARHGAATDEIAAALDEELRRRKLHRVREAVHDPGERFFLALLQNLPDREAILAMVRQRHPDASPRARVVAWLEALSGAGIIGVDLSDRLTREIVLAMLDGRALPGVLARLAETFDPREVDAGAPGITRQCERIRRTTLGPLFV